MEIIKDYTIVLSNKSLQHLGQLTDLKNVKFNAHLNSANEISFTAYKSEIGVSEPLQREDIEAYQDYIWNNLIDFKTIWVKELNEYFQIRVSTDDSNDTTKSVTGTSLCESELSQTNLYNLEINSEVDLAISDYKATTFYNAEDESCSLLHRVLSKVPHYKIKHVDKSLCNLQRTFSVDGTSIYDFLTGECSEQFDCLFVFDTVSENNSTAYRYVSVYDLMTVCEECGERGDFTDTCPKCKSTNLTYFGQDTTIYVDKDNLTDSIRFEMDSENVKNCFKLEAGDDIMTSAVRSLNPNGTDYLYLLREDDKKDMPKTLVEKLDEYSVLYDRKSPIIKDLTQQEYDLKDKRYYYQSSMMPTFVDLTEAPTFSNVETPREGTIYVHGNMAYLFDGTDFVPQHEDTDFLLELAPLYETVTSFGEAAKLTVANLSPIALQLIHEQTSTATVNTALKNYAKLFVKTGYVKLDIDENKSSFILDVDESGNLITDEKGYHSGTWYGQFIVTSYSNEEDITCTGEMGIRVTDNYLDFLTQKAKKAIGTNNDEEGSVFDILSIENMEHFKKALTLYSASRLESFSGALEAALSVLQGKNQADKKLSALFDSLYVPYEQKAKVCAEQLSTMQSKIADIDAQLAIVDSQKKEIQTELNLEKHLGDLYPIFCSYKREDKYSNSNYISDGLNNVQLINRATEFWELAQKEIQKSANGQYNITSTLHNLLAMKEFAPLTEFFKLGNWIRVRVDGQLYRLRLIGYGIDYDNLQTLSTTFSTVTKIPNLKAERQSILASAKSLATNFGYVSKQAEKGQEANANMSAIVQNGLNSGLIRIKNNNQEEVTYGKHGLLLREYDDILDDYTGKQCKLTHNAMVYTTDNWETASQAIGEHEYTYYDKETNHLKTDIGYGVTAQFCQSAYIYGGQILGADIYSVDYDKANGVGSHIGLTGRGAFNFGNALSFDGSNGYIGSEAHPYRWTLGNDDTRAYIYSGTTSMSSTDTGTYLGTDGFRNFQSKDAFVNISNGILECNGANISGTITGSEFKSGSITIGNNFSVDSSGNLIASNATLSGKITANTGKIGGWSVGTSTLSAGNVTLNSNGSLSGSNWSISNAGLATFSNVNITGGSVAGKTIGSGIQGGNINNGSINKNKFDSGVATWVGDIAAGKITANTINTALTDVSISLLAPSIHNHSLRLYKYESLIGTPTIILDGSTGRIDLTLQDIDDNNVTNTIGRWIYVQDVAGNTHKIPAVF